MFFVVDLSRKKKLTSLKMWKSIDFIWSIFATIILVIMLGIVFAGIVGVGLFHSVVAYVFDFIDRKLSRINRSS